jgi:hypothetical protein
VSLAHDVPGDLSRVAVPCSWIRFSDALGSLGESSGVICLFHINVGGQLSLQLAPVTPRVYQSRGINALQLLFKKYFQSFADQYGAKHAIIYGRFRIERITEVVEKFILCGDYSQGVVRIQCTNPECKYEYFRPFSRSRRRGYW